MKKTILFIVICLVAILSVGCSSIQSPLGIPDKIRVEDGVLRWNSVTGANKYAVFIEGSEVAVIGDTSYNLSSLDLVDGQTYKVAVMAKGDGYIKLDGELSEEITYTHVSKPADDGGYEIPTEVEEVTENKIADTLFESGLGYGVNALTAESAIGGVRSAAFFDEDLFDMKNIGSYNIGSSRSRATTKESIKDEILSINAKLVYGSSASASLAGMFTAGFEQKFSLSTAVQSKNHVNQCYFIMNHYIVGKNYQIKNYQQTRNYKDKVSDEVKRDLDALRNDEISAGDFFDTYGTHLVMAVAYGGMTEIYYATFAKETINSYELSTRLEASLNSGMSYAGVGAGASTDFGAELDGKYKKNTSTRMTSVCINSIGGEVQPAFSFESFSNSYPDWATSMREEKNYRIVDVADKGLVPIWNYLPDEYNDVKTKLSGYFETEAAEIGNKLADKMTPPEGEKATTARIKLEPKNCRLDNGYNPAEQSSDELAKGEINKNLFELIVNGTTQKDGKYSVVDNLSLTLKLMQDPFNIGRYKITVNGKTSGIYDAWIENDSASSAKDTTIGKRIGKGAVYINITYTDGTTDQGYATNICADIGKDSSINVFQVTGVSPNKGKALESIEIVTVYEIAARWSGVAWGITWTNWRTETVLQFR